MFLFSIKHISNPDDNKSIKIYPQKNQEFSILAFLLLTAVDQLYPFLQHDVCIEWLKKCFSVSMNAILTVAIKG